MKNFINVHSRQANSFVATAFGVVVTVLLIGGYEATHAVTGSDIVTAQTPRTVQAEQVVRLDTIVVTAKRG